MSIPKWTMIVVIAALSVGCPVNSLLPLAGDARWVGTWEGNNVLLGYHVFTRDTYDGNGNYFGYMKVKEDGSEMTYGGTWYADPQKGYYDRVRTWTYPRKPDWLGTFRGLYEIRGDTMETWNNPLNMERPLTRESAYTHLVEKRVTSKQLAVDFGETETLGVVQEILEFFH